jgi:glutamate dehydrogenase/leucine dehydrogenase
MDSEWRRLCDPTGPEKIVLVRDDAVGLEAMVVVDNVAIGPAIGGVRMVTDVTVEEVCRLARAMSLKNAAAQLRHGGAKAGIVGSPDVSASRRETLLRSFARAIRDLTEFVPGPDMGTNEESMAWIYDEIGRAVGLPAVLGGIPLDEFGMTGFGLAVCAEAVEAAGLLRLEGARVVVQGFGAVGRHAASCLAERGARIIAVADTGGAVFDADGLDVDKLNAWKGEGRSVALLPGSARVDPADLVALDCEVWVPAARPDVFTAANADAVRAQVILSGANVPATEEAEERLNARGVVVVPDFIANAGGVICAAVEYRGGTRAEALETIEHTISRNTREVLARSSAAGATPRAVAVQMASDRLTEAARYRRGARPIE